jgi:hypothetical protein
MYANYYVIRLGKKPGRKRNHRFSVAQVWQHPPGRNSQRSIKLSRRGMHVRIHRKGR